jgi:hypothetical protein
MMALIAIVAVLSGCSRDIDGSAAMGPREVDPAYFFAGAVPTYGQHVNPDEVTALAYQRAVRRIDPCGLLTRDAMTKIGESVPWERFTRSTNAMSTSRCLARPTAGTPASR